MDNMFNDVQPEHSQLLFLVYLTTKHIITNLISLVSIIQASMQIGPGPHRYLFTPAFCQESCTQPREAAGRCSMQKGDHLFAELRWHDCSISSYHRNIYLHHSSPVELVIADLYFPGCSGKFPEVQQKILEFHPIFGSFQVPLISISWQFCLGRTSTTCFLGGQMDMQQRRGRFVAWCLLWQVAWIGWMDDEEGWNGMCVLHRWILIFFLRGWLVKMEDDKILMANSEC